MTPTQTPPNEAVPDFIRTPAARFDGLADFPFPEHYTEWQGLRMHYLDEGEGPPVLLLHGEPTWSYLYRSIIPPLVDAGFRCLAPDYVGFGKSDKVLDDGWYVIERHIESIAALIEALDLRDVTLVVHDWGGPIGLRQAVDTPDRFARLVILNTWVHHEGFQYPESLQQFRQFATGFAPGTGDVATGALVAGTLAGLLDDAARAGVQAGYDAPFPDAASKAGARRFPWLLPFAQPAEGNAADQQRVFDALASWQKPAHVIFGDSDPIFSVEWGRQFASHIPDATFETVPGTHFVQEVSGPQIAETMLAHMT